MRTIVSLVVGLALFAAAPAHASFHLWDFNEVYSNADGNVQFIEFFTTSNFERFVAGHTITSGSNSFTFPENISASTANHHLLLATSGFADLDGGVEPDFEIPSQFLDPSEAVLTFNGLNPSRITFANLPTDGINSLNYAGFIDDGVLGVNSPTNFAGISGSIVPARALPSDLTGDGFIDFGDLTILLANWNTDVGAGRGNLVDPTTTLVNFQDLTLLLADWTGPGPVAAPADAVLAEAAVPEPSTFALAFVAMLTGLPLLRRRRRP